MLRTRKRRIGSGFISNSFARFFNASLNFLGLNGLVGCGTLVDGTQRSIDASDGGEPVQCPYFVECESTNFPLNLLDSTLSHITQYPTMRGTFTQTETASLVSDGFVIEYTSTFKDNSDSQRGLVRADSYGATVRFLGGPYLLLLFDHTSGVEFYRISDSKVLSTNDVIFVKDVQVKLLGTRDSSIAVIGFFNGEGQELSRIEAVSSNGYHTISLVNGDCVSTLILKISEVSDGLANISIVSQDVFLSKSGDIETNGLKWIPGWTSYLEFNEHGDLTEIRITGHRNWDVCL